MMKQEKKTKIKININKIVYFKDREIGIADIRCFCKETYEEIKQKIKQAQGEK